MASGPAGAEDHELEAVAEGDEGGEAATPTKEEAFHSEGGEEEAGQELSGPEEWPTGEAGPGDEEHWKGSAGPKEEEQAERGGPEPGTEAERPGQDNPEHTGACGKSRGLRMGRGE
jgi:hypothetical protein